MKTTNWYPANTKPVRVGWYQIQNDTLRCNCCYMDAYWNGSEFVRFGRFADLLDVYEAFRGVTRWRGVSRPPAEAS